MKKRRGALACAILLISAAGASAALFSIRVGQPPLPPPHRHEYLSDAKIAFVDGDFALAERLLQGLTGTEAKTLLGRVLLERGRREEASRLFEEVLKQDPTHFEAVRGMATACQRLGRTDAAVLYWRRLTELRKDDARAWRGLGMAQREAGDGMGALITLQRSLSLDPGQGDLAKYVTELASDPARTAGPLPGLTSGTENDLLRPRPLDPIGPASQPRILDPNQTNSRSGIRIR